MNELSRHKDDSPVLSWNPVPGAALRESDVLDMIASARSQDAEWIAIDAQALPEDFYRLESGVAGMALQKFVNYGVKLAVVGDIAPWLARSNAFSAFVREANRGRTTWFVADHEELRHRLQARDGRA